MKNYIAGDTEQVQNLKHILGEAEILYKEEMVEEADEKIREAEEMFIDYIAVSDYGILATMAQVLQKARTWIAKVEGGDD